MSNKIKLNSPLIIILIITLILAIGYLAVNSSFSKNDTPRQFLQARISTGQISQKIIKITNSINQQIKKINNYDLDGDSIKALNLIKETANNNKKAYDLAFSLSESIKEMTESLKEIHTLDGQRVAQAAISLELALIAEFINYNRLLNNFLEHLSSAIATKNNAYRKQVENDISKINSKALIINSLDKDYHKKMGELNKILNLNQ